MTFGPIASANEGYFVVSVSSTNSPAIPSNNLWVEVLVENTDAESGEKKVELHVAGEKRDSENVSLKAGSSTKVILSWDITKDDVGIYSAEIKTTDESITQDVEVLESGPLFGVSITDSSTKVSKGESAYVDGVVYNHGSIDGTKEVDIDVTKQ